ncbi:MAG: ribosome maturation factor RimM [Gemmatimonadota bacterium]
MTGRPAPPDHLVVGHLPKPHGTKGEMFVWPLTDTPDEVFAPGRTLILGDEQGAVGVAPEPLVVERARSFKRGLLVKFEGLDDRTAVELLAGRYVLVPADELTEPAEDEFMYHELLGLQVETADGTVVGRVQEVFETEPAHLLEVKADDRIHLIPLARRIVKVVDLEGGRLVIEAPPGLLDI